jgi:hypothetical protein
MIVETLTFLHVVISVVGIVSGLVVLFGLLSAQDLEGWATLFLATTVATSVTGFFFPVDRFLPSHAIGVLSLPVLAAAGFARYRRQLVGRWRLTYVVSAVVALYLNVFVLIVQGFLHVPILTAMAPTQSEPPFQVAQLLALVAFVTLGVAAVIRFRRVQSPIHGQPALRRPEPSRSV